ncbi:MAG TPA: hypothetical protein VFO76_05615, partial [Candidatus Kapabacteria bacterium]|nr:hypothetical protein [Candidatus Kapabacteria bacterium]
RSTNTDWYSGSSLLEILEAIPNRSAESTTGSFSVQYPISDTGSLYGGRILSGSLQAGDSLTHVPSLKKVVVSGLSLANEQFIQATAPFSINIEVSAGFPINRGDLLLKKEEALTLCTSAKATLCWLDESPLIAGRSYLFQQNAKVAECTITSIESLLDVRTNKSQPATSQELQQNNIATVTILFFEPLYLERYTDSRLLGSGIIIDPTTNATAGAILIEDLTR